MRSPNYSVRNHAIDRVTIHCLAGQLTAEEALALPAWTDTVPERQRASCNWIIGKDGSVACLVPEEYRSWCSSNRGNDMRAITIEVASSKTGDYVTPAAMDALDHLVTDIMRRYGKRRLLWLKSREATDAHKAAKDEMLLSVHRWYANKTCPGPVLEAHLDDIAHEYLDPGPSEWAAQAMAWATTAGLTDGTRPREKATREEVIAMLYRYHIHERRTEE